jgi:osmotically-inducible protein OsmY
MPAPSLPCQADLAEIRRRIDAAFRHVALAPPPAIAVRVLEGEVVLTGAVSCWEDGWLAEYAVWGTPGVDVVTNRLEVAGSAA